jgi:hypothetical protein
MDNLSRGLNGDDYYTTGYADYIAVLINGKYPVRGFTNSSRHSPPTVV